MIIARPKNGEPDLLSGNERCALRFVALNGRELVTLQPPQEGWTHDALDAVPWPMDSPWDAFLGNQWIGSSEV